jgi:hypothetical protein
MNEAIPSLSFLVFERAASESFPLFEQGSSAVLPREIRRERLFEATAEGHRPIAAGKAQQLFTSLCFHGGIQGDDGRKGLSENYC